MRLLLTVLFCSVMLPSAYAEKLPAPTGKPVLTISGKIGNTNAGDKAVFDLTAPKKLEMKTVKATTPWYTGKVRLDGIPLNKFMDLVGTKGKSACVLVLNDYITIIPIDNFYKFPVITALKMSGKCMRVRDKGPLFIVYLYDSSTELQNQIYYFRSAWQVSRIIIE